MSTSALGPAHPSIQSVLGFFLLGYTVWDVNLATLVSKLRIVEIYVWMLISFWLFLFPIFLFAAQRKEFFLDGLKKLEQRSHKCVELKGEYVE
jgi:hypothetical protein